MEKLNEKVALVTGSSSGIGRATAISLAKRGCSVVVNFRSNTKAAQAVVSQCNKYSTKNIAIQADVSKESDVAGMFKTIKKRYLQLDILVNNAGIFDSADKSTNIKAFENTYRNNFLSCVLVTKHALPLMKAGKIVNISSVHAQLGHGRPRAIAYSAFKAALESYTKNLAKNLAPNILVNAVAPGRTATAMWGNPKPNKQKELGRVHLIKRMIRPEEIADGVVFLIKNDAVCGEVLTIDGGMSLVTLG